MFEFPVCRVVFLPTTGHNPDNPWLPSERGILRIQAAGEALKDDDQAILLIAGGFANHHRFTSADRMAAYIAQHSAWMLERLVLVAGMHNRTVDDLTQSILLLGGLVEESGSRLMPSECVLDFCSEYPHFARLVTTMRTLGFNPRHVDSGGDESSYTERDRLLAEEFNPDKILGLGLDAMEWRRQALFRAQAQADLCQAWANEHPKADAAERMRVSYLLGGIQDRGVYLESPAIEPRRSRPPVPLFN